MRTLPLLLLLACGPTLPEEALPDACAGIRATLPLTVSSGRVPPQLVTDFAVDPRDAERVCFALSGLAQCAQTLWRVCDAGQVAYCASPYALGEFDSRRSYARCASPR